MLALTSTIPIQAVTTASAASTTAQKQSLSSSVLTGSKSSSAVSSSSASQSLSSAAVKSSTAKPSSSSAVNSSAAKPSSSSAVKGSSSAAKPSSSSISSSSSDSPATQFGAENRYRVGNTTVAPFRSIVYLEATFPDGTIAYGSGVLISQNNVLTAGHMIFDATYGGYATQIEASPGYNNHAYFGSAISNRYEVNSRFPAENPSTYSNPNHDIGIVRFAKAFDSRAGFLGVNYGSVSTSQTYTLTGFPGQVNGYYKGSTYYAPTVAGWMYSASGKILSVDSNLLYYTIDMTPGDSGGPVYNSSKQVVGINVAEDSNHVEPNMVVKVQANQSLISKYQKYTQYENAYRLYNPHSGEHFYTISAFEKDSLVKAGWRFEGINWWEPTNSPTPIYRLYNPNAGDHFYTTSSFERDSLVKIGWHYEGVSFYSDPSKGVPVYRLYNPNAKVGSHFYTTSATERNSLVKKGWRYESVSWYGQK